ncbi:MAG: class I tRNA ligase family protein, partial [Thermoproteota archaeon]
VMICTYGDKANVKTVLKNGLPVIELLTEDGRITEEGGKYAGMSTSEAEQAIVEDLEAAGLLEKTEVIQQEVGVCERCDTAIEILERKQWFMNTRRFTDKVVEAAEEVVWYPDYMKTRLMDWANSLDWDWVISRQRVFGTPIPIWYCKDCGRKIIAEEDGTPIDPKLEDPEIEECPECGGTSFIPEKDVFDTWMDSSITCAVHAGWPNRPDWRRLFPADVHPSGIDIIRTWAYYLMVRHLALFDEKPYKTCLINGMVLGADGRKMSKSLKNYTATSEVLDKYGADAARQWAASGGATGSDIPFRWPDVKYGWRFLIKLWNASRFVNRQLEDFTPQPPSQYHLRSLDRWILSKAEKMTQVATDALEECQFNTAVEEVRNFTWHVFCDLYLEAVKDRLYNPEVYGEEAREAAQYTLYTVLYRIMQLLAPVTPHVTEEIYQRMFSSHMDHRSLHLSSWPIVDEGLIDEEVEKQGDLIMAVIREVRREKSEKQLSLNTEIKRLTIYAGEEEKAENIRRGREDIMGTCKVSTLEVKPKAGQGRELEQYDDIQFTTEY